jgi:hypothetical protein
MGVMGYLSPVMGLLDEIPSSLWYLLQNRPAWLWFPVA